MQPTHFSKLPPNAIILANGFVLIPLRRSVLILDPNHNHVDIARTIEQATKRAR